MTCSKCGTPLQAVRMEHGVFWRCEQCGGRALGVNLLRRTFVREAINEVWGRATNNNGFAGRACPSCHNSMIEVAATDQPEPRIDVCRLCHFVWFDADEISHFAPLPPPAPKPAELPQKAREAIALAKVEQLAREAEMSKWGVDPTDRWWTQVAHLFALPVDF